MNLIIFIPVLVQSVLADCPDALIECLNEDKVVVAQIWKGTCFKWFRCMPCHPDDYYSNLCIRITDGRAKTYRVCKTNFWLKNRSNSCVKNLNITKKDESLRSAATTKIDAETTPFPIITYNRTETEEKTTNETTNTAIKVLISTKIDGSEKAAESSTMNETKKKDEKNVNFMVGLILAIIIVIIISILTYLMIGISKRKREKIWEKIDVELDCRGNEIKLKSNESGGEVESGIRTGVDLDEIGSQELKPISRFALSQHEIKNLEDEKILLSRDTLQISTSRIGAGHFGNVYKGILKYTEDKCEWVAVKKLNCSNSDMSKAKVDSFIREAIIMKDFEHDNVLSIIGIMIDDNGLPILISKLMAQDVTSFITNDNNQVTIRLLIEFSLQIAKGMAYICNLKYVHRDLALRNCLLDQDLVTIKVSDFGLSRDIYENNHYIQRSNEATPWKWMSPESLKYNVFNHCTDVWSYGVVMWELITQGSTPYPEMFSKEIVDFLESNLRLSCPSYCPNILYEIMLECWNLNAKVRPTFNQLVNKVNNVISFLDKNLENRLDEKLLKNEIFYKIYPINMFYRAQEDKCFTRNHNYS